MGGPGQRSPGRSQDGEEIVLPGAGAPATVDEASLTFVGAATVLLEYAGLTVLTDPSFLRRGQEAPIGYGMRTVRNTDPAVTIEELPPVDVVVLSHYHGDHFDPVAERHLDRGLPLVTTPHAAAILKRKGFRRAHGLSTWETLTLSKGDARLQVTALPGNHRPGLSWLFPPVMGSLLDFHYPPGRRRLTVYLTGDTLLHPALHEIPRRVPPIDYMLAHLGGTRVAGLLLTMDGRQGVQLMRLVRPSVTIPIHFHDYRVYRAPLADFQQAVRAAGLERGVRYIGHGQTLRLEVPPAQREPAAAAERAA